MSGRARGRPGLHDIARRQQQGRPVYHEEPREDRLLSLLVETAEDLCVLRDRLDTARRLAAAGKPVTDETIDAFEVDEQLEAERLERHRACFEDLFRRLDGS